MFYFQYKAPAPTSTETLPLPTELKGVKAESEQEDEVEDSDWNCGDLAWAAVPSFPYWPCAITRDPVDRKYVKQACKTIIILILFDLPVHFVFKMVFFKFYLIMWTLSECSSCRL